ncbi:MAG: C40 family peptidase [Bacteroidetes bacterium]|nr:C40 family peptidase [Bacteroidota bacterium]
MPHGICLLSIVPVRREPTHIAEMCTQLLFGELYTVLQSENNWLKVSLEYDGYEGWISEKGHTALDDNEFETLTQTNARCTLDLVQLVTNETKKEQFPILYGSSLPGIEEFSMKLSDQTFVYDGQVSMVSDFEEDDEEGPENLMELKHDLVHDSMQFLGAPYLWGGRSLFGIDCSGLVQMVYKLKNIRLKRDASQQAEQGEPVNSLDEAEPGDLAFFENEEGKISHVGILADRQKILHCSGKVRLDVIDLQGIYHNDLHEYTHKLKMIRRVI